MRTKSEELAYWLLKDLNKAIYQFGMIEDGDRIAVAVSGGKDSLTLLKLLDIRRSFIRESYDIVAIHISGDSQGPITPPHPPLTAWLEEHYNVTVIEELMIPDSENTPMNCHRCSWNRKKQIFEIANRMDCNVLALGHHADDIAQTTLLNLIFHGRVETISPKSEYFGGVIRLIRPLIYITEQEIIKYSKASNFPPPPPSCVYSTLSQRQVISDFLENTYRHFPHARKNLIRAGLSGNLEKSNI